jgi:hypothetical protein
VISYIEMFRATRILWKDLIESGKDVGRFYMISELHDRVERQLTYGGRLEWTQEEEDRLFVEGRRLYRLDDGSPWRDWE